MGCAGQRPEWTLELAVGGAFLCVVSTPASSAALKKVYIFGKIEDVSAR